MFVDHVHALNIGQTDISKKQCHNQGNTTGICLVVFKPVVSNSVPQFHCKPIFLHLSMEEPQQISKTKPMNAGWINDWVWLADSRMLYSKQQYCKLNWTVNTIHGQLWSTNRRQFRRLLIGYERQWRTYQYHHLVMHHRSSGNHNITATNIHDLDTTQTRLYECTHVCTLTQCSSNQTGHSL